MYLIIHTVMYVHFLDSTRGSVAVEQLPKLVENGQANLDPSRDVPSQRDPLGKLL